MLARTPPKGRLANDSEPQRSPTETTTQMSKVRRSIGDWEAAKPGAPPASAMTTTVTQPCPIKARQKATLSQERKTTADRRASFEAVTTPPKQTKYTDKVSEARACLCRAKLHLNNSRNLKTDIKNEVMQAIDRLYSLVKESEEEKKGSGMKGTEQVRKSDTEAKIIRDKSDVVAKLEEHTKMLIENSRKIDQLKVVIEEQNGNLSKMTYAQATSTKPAKNSPERTTLHSIIVTSEEENDTGETVLDRVREAIDAKEGWVKVAKVRRAKDRKIIMSCDSQEDRQKVKERLEKAGKHLVVEDVKNKDPLIVLKDVLLINSDEDVIRAMRNQNKPIFHGLDGEENRIQIKYRRKARNPHAGHIVVSTSPKIWQRVVNAGTLHIDLQHVKVADQSPLVQCSRCLGYGHSKRFCVEAVDLCSHCGGPHLRSGCVELLAGSAPSCKNCLKAGLARVEHNAFSNDCPVRKRWDLLARSAIAYC